MLVVNSAAGKKMNSFLVITTSCHHDQSLNSLLVRSDACKVEAVQNPSCEKEPLLP